MGISTGWASGMLRRRWNDSCRRISQDIRTAPECLTFLFRHFRLQDLAYALPSEHAWKRNRDRVIRVVRADGDDRVLVAQDGLGDARRHHADPQLAGASPFDDGDI